MPARESNGNSSLNRSLRRALERVALRVVDLFDRLHRQIADGQTADPVRRRHVAIEQCGRRRQHRRDVVESVAGIVDRQPFAGPDVDGQQIADGVAVLGAIQAMHRRAARIRIATAARSSVVSRKVANAAAASGSGRVRTVDGGISPERTLRRTFSQTLAVFRNVGEAQILKREARRLGLSLWQVTQLFSTRAACDVVLAAGEGAGTLTSR